MLDFIKHGFIRTINSFFLWYYHITFIKKENIF